MSATIFCTFDQQDLADLAVGRLRSEFSGINHVSYSLSDLHEHPGHSRDGVNIWAGGVYDNAVVGTGVTPSRPATVRITCEDSVKDQVVSRLFNLHAYRIVEA